MQAHVDGDEGRLSFYRASITFFMSLLMRSLASYRHLHWLAPLFWGVAGVVAGCFGAHEEVVFRPCFPACRVEIFLPQWAARGVSLLGYGVALWCMGHCLSLLTPGTQGRSRGLYLLLTLALCPMMVRAAWSAAPDVWALCVGLASLWLLLLALERGHRLALLLSTAPLLLTVGMKGAWAALLLPIWMWVGVKGLRRRQWALTVLAGLLLGAGLWLAAWQGQPFGVWAWRHFFQRSFEGQDAAYALPNALYVLYPWAHPAFCLLLSGLLLLAKPTDQHRGTHRMLLLGMFTYLLGLGGLPRQWLPDLLPAYCVLLLLFFPAWDRMVAYGGHFFPRLTHRVLLAFALTQGIGTLYFLVK
ncbi:MAG TPA: hypothetical protein PK858_10055 [Saprospiraceae bacterium]|nr:hypothetical protein [Saprospiraceae bacterium]